MTSECFGEGWTDALRDELRRNASNNRVGTRLVSETPAVRVWLVSLQPGERLPFHCHALDYFWTAATDGKAISHTSDGRILVEHYRQGDTQHHRYDDGERMIHDLENIGPAPLVFTTVEFLRVAEVRR